MTFSFRPTTPTLEVSRLVTIETNHPSQEGSACSGSEVMCRAVCRLRLPVVCLQLLRLKWVSSKKPTTDIIDIKASEQEDIWKECQITLSCGEFGRVLSGELHPTTHLRNAMMRGKQFLIYTYSYHVELSQVRERGDTSEQCLLGYQNEFNRQSPLEWNQV